MAFEQAYLAAHPLPPGIVGALGLGGYQLLVDVAGVGAGRLGSQAFLLVAPEPDPSVPDAGTQIALHQTKLRDEREMAAFTQLAAQLGYMRLSGYRLALERHGLRSKVNVVNPATGAIAATIPDRHPGRLFGGGANASALLGSGGGPRGVAPGAAGAGAARRVRRWCAGRGARRPRSGAGAGRSGARPAGGAGGRQAGGRLGRPGGGSVGRPGNGPSTGVAREVRSARSRALSARNVVPE